MIDKFKISLTPDPILSFISLNIINHENIDCSQDISFTLSNISFIEKYDLYLVITI